MKYLTKYNESLLKIKNFKDLDNWSDKPSKKELSEEFIEIVFDDFLDDGAKIDFQKGELKSSCHISIPNDESGFDDIDSYLSMCNKNLDIATNIKTAIRRMESEYDGIKVIIPL